MAVIILDVKTECCPATRLIGKRYVGSANWSEWWENNLIQSEDERKRYRR